MNVIKRQSIANWISLGTLIFALIGFILYAVNIGSAGYFNGVTVSSLVTWCVIAMVLVVVTIAMAQFSFDGIVGKVYGIVLDALRILIPLLLFIAMFAFISSRVEGLAYIYFSNPDVLETIQTSENLASATTAITGFVFFGISAFVDIIAAFFSAKKKNV